jgi:hypothetical protein
VQDHAGTRLSGWTATVRAAIGEAMSLVSGWLYGGIGPSGFWLMAALCGIALPFARRL